MPPSWIPMCKCMQVYCEPYFAAMERWRICNDESLLLNRLQLVETIGFVFHSYSPKRDVYKFDIVWENEAIELLPEVFPTPGKEFKQGGDQAAFAAAKARCNPDIFTKSGVFFQENLLKAMAGWNADILAASNKDTRKSIITVVEKLFRLPEEAGAAHLTYALENVEEPYMRANMIDLPLNQLGDKGVQFYEFLRDYRHGRLPGQTMNGAGAGGGAPTNLANEKGKKRTKGRERETGNAEEGKEVEWEEDSDGVLWTSMHHSVGSCVAAHFPPLEVHADIVPRDGAHADPHRVLQSQRDSGLVSKLFRGKVVKYARPTAPGKLDQLYHVLWDDGDEQDFDENDFQRGMDLFDKEEGWTVRHASVGTKVAAWFPNILGNGKPSSVQPYKIFQGKVTKYGPPAEKEVRTAENMEDAEEEEGPLYHILWEDGDEADYDETELQEGVKLYKEHFPGKNTTTGASSNSNNKLKPKLKPKAGRIAVSAADTAGSSDSKKKKEKEEEKKKNKQKTAKPSREERHTASRAYPEPVYATTAAAMKTQVQGGNSSSYNTNNNDSSSSSSSSSSSGGGGTDSSKRAASTTTSSNEHQVSNKPKKQKTEQKATTAATATATAKKPKKDKEEEVVEWTTDHDSIGRRVAKHFWVDGKWEVFGGTVVRFALPSRPNRHDHLYHIFWDDEDEADFDEAELQAGLLLLETLMPTSLIRAPPHLNMPQPRQAVFRHELLVAAADSLPNSSSSSSSSSSAAAATATATISTADAAADTATAAITTADTAVAAVDTVGGTEGVEKGTGQYASGLQPPQRENFMMDVAADTVVTAADTVVAAVAAADTFVAADPTTTTTTTETAVPSAATTETAVPSAAVGDAEDEVQVELEAEEEEVLVVDVPRPPPVVVDLLVTAADSSSSTHNIDSKPNTGVAAAGGAVDAVGTSDAGSSDGTTAQPETTPEFNSSVTGPGTGVNVSTATNAVVGMPPVTTNSSGTGSASVIISTQPPTQMPPLPHDKQLQHP